MRVMNVGSDGLGPVLRGRWRECAVQFPGDKGPEASHEIKCLDMKGIRPKKLGDGGFEREERCLG